MIAQLLEVFLLLGQLVLELQELRLLALSDRVILVGLLAALEGITVRAEPCQPMHPLSLSLWMRGDWPLPATRGTRGAGVASRHGTACGAEGSASSLAARGLDDGLSVHVWQLGRCGNLALISFGRPGQQGPPCPPCFSCDGVRARDGWILTS